MLLLASVFSSSLFAFDYSNHWGVTLDGGLNTEAMGDVNSVINKYGGSLNSGEEAALTISYGFSPQVLMNVGVGEILNSASFNGGYVSLPALSIMAGGEYVVFPQLFGFLDAGFCGALEYDILDGSTSIDPGVISNYEGVGYQDNAHAKHPNLFWAGSGGSTTPSGSSPSGQNYLVTDCSGSTFGGELSAKFRYFVFSHLPLGLELGYRLAHVYGVNGVQTWNGVSGPENESVDYSGFFTRLSAGYFF